MQLLGKIRPVMLNGLAFYDIDFDDTICLERSAASEVKNLRSFTKLLRLCLVAHYLSISIMAQAQNSTSKRLFHIDFMSLFVDPFSIPSNDHYVTCTSQSSICHIQSGYSLYSLSQSRTLFGVPSQQDQIECLDLVWIAILVEKVFQKKERSITLRIFCRSYASLEVLDSLR